MSKLLVEAYEKIIEDYSGACDSLESQIKWNDVHYDSLRAMHGRYHREMDTKLRHYLVENYELSKRVAALEKELGKK